MEFFCFSHNICARTIFKGVKALPPASLLTFVGSGVDLKQYWKLSFEKIRSKSDINQLKIEAARALRDGALKKLGERSHLGMGLSGGLDSRLVAALVPSGETPLYTRTYGMKGSQNVEAAIALAGKLGLDHFVHQPKDVQLFSYLHPSVWRTECRVHFTGLKSILEHGSLMDKFWYNLNGHFGDVLTGKQLRPFMFRPLSRKRFIDKVFTHYTWYTYRDENLLRSIFKEEFVQNYLPKVKKRFCDSMEAINERHNWNTYDVWDLTHRQPRFTFSSCAVDNYLFGKASLLTDYSYVDIMLRVPGSYRFGQAFYKSMLAKHFPEISEVPNANTGKRVSKSMLKNLGDLLAQYHQSRRNRKLESGEAGGKADLFRRDIKLKDWILASMEEQKFLENVFSKEGIEKIVSEHYDFSKDRSYILGVLSTYLAAHEIFFTGDINKTPNLT